MSTHFSQASRFALAAAAAATLVFASWAAMAQQSGGSASGQGGASSAQGASAQGGSGQSASGSTQGTSGQGQATTGRGSSQSGQGQSGVGQNSTQGTRTGGASGQSASGASGQADSGRTGQGTSGTNRGTRTDASDDSGQDRLDRGATNRTGDDRGTSGQRSDDFDNSSDTNRLGDDRRTGDRAQGSREDRSDRNLGDRDDQDFNDRSVGSDNRSSDRNDRSDRGDSFDRTQRGDSDIEIGARLMNDGSDRLMVRDIESRGILGRAGLRDGDLIISAGGRRVTSGDILARMLIGGRRVPLVVWRDGAQRTIYVEDGGYQSRARFDYGYDDDVYQTDRAWLGVFLDMRFDNAAIVQAVQEGSAAERAGIRAGDRITSVNGQRVNSPSQLTQIIGQMEPGENVQLNVARWQTRQTEAQLGERPSTTGRYRYLEDESDAPQQGRSSGEFNRRNENQSSNDDFRNQDRENFSDQP